jgi:hypothetical protein
MQEPSNFKSKDSCKFFNANWLVKMLIMNNDQNLSCHTACKEQLTQSMLQTKRGSKQKETKQAARRMMALPIYPRERITLKLPFEWT